MSVSERWSSLAALGALACVGAKALVLFDVPDTNLQIVTSLFDDLLWFSGTLVATRLARILPSPWKAWAFTSISLFSLGAAFISIVALMGMRATGSVPRTQQLAGLTWKTVGPSIIPAMQQYGLSIALGMTIACVTCLAWVRLPWPSVGLRSRLGLLLFFTLGRVVLSYQPTHPPTPPLWVEVFRSDLDLLSTSLEDGLVAKQFESSYEARLKTDLGVSDLWSGTYETLKGSNVVVISMESVRAKDLAFYDGPERLPFLESVKNQTVVLERMYSGDIRSTKSFTALELGEFELLSWKSYSADFPERWKERSLALQLKQLGYTTHAMVNGDPNYDRNAQFHRARGYDHVLYQPEINQSQSDPNSDDLKMLDRVDELLQNAKDRPVYFLLWPFGTHHPYGRSYWAHMEDWRAAHPEGIKFGGPDDHQRYIRSLYELDDFLRELVAVFKKHGKYERTIFFFIGDHGEAFGEHRTDNIFHGNDVYEESIRVAALIHSPQITHLQHDDRIWMLKDIPATVLDIAGAKSPYWGVGRSLLHTYEQELPAYIYNSWTRKLAIVNRAFKLRKDLAPNGKSYFASLDELTQDPDAELKVLSATDSAASGAMLQELEQWLVARRHATVKLNAQKDVP